jgi:hypothetical protein
MVRALAVLPATYTPEIYKLFIQFWGTHYTNTAYFGGIIEQQTLVQDCVFGVAGFNNTVVLQQVNVDFSNSLTKGTVPVIQQYALHRKLGVLDMYGGNPEIVNWQTRVPTFEDNPVPVKFTYAPIYNLIADPVKKANLLKATTDYVAQWQASMTAQATAIAAQAQAEFNQAKTLLVAFEANYNLWGPIPHKASNEIQFPFISAAAGGSVHPPDLSGTCMANWEGATLTNTTQDFSYGEVQDLNDVQHCSWNMHACVHCERDATGQLRVNNDPKNSKCTGAAITGPWVKQGCSPVKITQKDLWVIVECCFICPSA